MKRVKWSITAILALVVAGFAFTYFSPDYNMYIVRSESMKPAINMGDMVLTGPLGGMLNGEIKPGMIVTYEHGKGLVTHRVLSVDGDTLVTKGDAMEEADPHPVALSQVSGVYLFRIPYIGYLSNFMRTKLGWFLVIIIPAMVLVGFLIKDILKEAFRGDSENTGTATFSRVGKGNGNTRRVTDWYAPWHHRRRIRIRGSQRSLTDYKAKVIINTQELISAGKMQPDGADIRFTQADGVTTIPYWLKSGINTTSTIIWLRIPFIPSSGSAIYLYYGNPAAAPASDRSAIFTFNDELEQPASKPRLVRV